MNFKIFIPFLALLSYCQIVYGKVSAFHPPLKKAPPALSTFSSKPRAFSPSLMGVELQIETLYLKKGDTPPSASIEKMSLPFLREDLLNDLVFNLQKIKDHELIEALFYPNDHTASTYDLEHCLQNGLKAPAVNDSPRLDKRIDSRLETLHKTDLVNEKIPQKMSSHPHLPLNKGQPLSGKIGNSRVRQKYSFPSPISLPPNGFYSLSSYYLEQDVAFLSQLKKPLPSHILKPHITDPFFSLSSHILPLSLSIERKIALQDPCIGYFFEIKKEFFHPSKGLQTPFFPKTESIDNASLKSFATFVPPKGTRNYSMAKYPFQNQRKRHLIENRMGRLIKHHQKSFSRLIPDYSKGTSLSSFPLKKIDSHSKNKAVQGSKVASKLCYTHPAFVKSVSSITPKGRSLPHPFKATLCPTPFKDKTKPIATVLFNKATPIQEKICVDYTKDERTLLTLSDVTLPSKFYPTPPLEMTALNLFEEVQVKNWSVKENFFLLSGGAKTVPTPFYPTLSLPLIDSHTLSFEESLLVNRTYRMTQGWLFNQPSLAELNTDSFSDSCILETKVLLNPSLEGNNFSCSLRLQDIMPSLPVHVLYVLDTSSSIESHRFALFKEAIIASLDHLDPTSTFNIAILSKGKVEMLHEQNPHPTSHAKGFAKRYLKKVDQGQKTSFTDVVELIKKEKTLASKKLTHTACLFLSDGKFANNIRVDQKLLKDLTETKSENFSLYTAQVSDQNNKGMLSLLAKLHHGFSLHTPTHASFSRKFSVLTKHIKHPLIHDVQIFFPGDDSTQAYISDKVGPIVLADKAFTFYGTSSERKNSRVFIQGRSGDRWINIVKEIPLTTARKARGSVIKKLYAQKALLSLASFVETYDEHDLLEAKKWGKESDLILPIP